MIALLNLSVGSSLNRGRTGIDIVTLVLLLKMRVRVVLWNMRVWVGLRVGRVGFGEWAGWGRVGWVW